MAKTIKEMANEAFPINRSQTNLDRYFGYMTGANAVLEEIINCFPDTPFCNPNEVIDIIASRIKQLKG